MTSKRFRRRTPYIKTEAILSWMIRTRIKNHYGSVHTIMRYLRKTLRMPYLTANQISQGKSIEAIELLSKLGEVSVEELIAGTSLYYKELLQPPFAKDKEFMDLDAAYGLFRKDPLACPCCMNESSFLRLAWYLDFIFLCSKHGCLMTNVCYGCGNTLTSEELVCNSCANCSKKFTDTPLMILDPSSAIKHSQQLLWKLTENDLSIIPNMTANALLWVILGIKNVNSAAGAEWEYHQEEGLDFDIMLYNYVVKEGLSLATATKALLDWPVGFHNFLDNYRLRPSKPNGHGISNEFGNLYTTWLRNRWVLPQFQFVHDAFNDYVAKFLPPYERLKRNEWAKSYPKIRKESDFISVGDASKEYNCPLVQILEWLRSGQLSKHTASDGVIEYLKRSELETLMR
jgi:hypothetical protein